MADEWKKDRIGSALQGENPTVLRRLGAGFAVIGDVQFLPGYSVLLVDDPRVQRLSELSKGKRLGFLSDMDRLGEAVELLCGKYGQYKDTPPQGPVVAVRVDQWSGWACA